MLLQVSETPSPKISALNFTNLNEISLFLVVKSLPNEKTQIFLTFLFSLKLIDNAFQWGATVIGTLVLAWGMYNKSQNFPYPRGTNCTNRIGNNSKKFILNYVF